MFYAVVEDFLSIYHNFDVREYMSQYPQGTQRMMLFKFDFYLLKLFIENHTFGGVVDFTCYERCTLCNNGT
jgi:hypothetical protein